MRIATWNVNSVNARLETVLAWFEEAAPDVACLQEIKTVDEKFPREGFERLGYNVVPTDADIYNPRSWLKNALLQPEPRAAYQRLLSQGWTDALAALHPEQAPWTFWQYLRNAWLRDAGLRLDHLLLSASVALRLEDAGVDRWTRGEPDASDHAPAWIVLDQP
jgi:exodeoxyribonuclease-3